MTTASNDEIRILTPSGMLGYGFPVDHFKMGLAQKPHAITIDSGSTDSGPQKLGLGEMTCSREAYVKDIEVLLEAQHEAQDPAADLVGRRRRHQSSRRCLSRHRHRYRPQARLALQARLDLCRHRQGPYQPRASAGRIEPLGPVPPLDQREVDAATVVVAQMGAEPFVKALDESEGVDVVRGRPLLRSLADRGDGDPRRLRSGAGLAHGQDHGMRRALRRAGRPQRHGLPAARPFRDRAAQSRRALHHGLGGRPHALRKDPSLPAGRPRRHARSFQLQVRAGDRPARARIGQPLRARPSTTR